MLAKINRFIRKLSIPINIFNIIIGLFVGIAHVYLPFTSMFGLILGILMAISGSVSMGISYWFTSKNSESHNAANQEERPPLLHTPESNAFLAVAIPMLLLNTASSFFGMYTGTLLLAAALSFAISPPATIAIAVVLSTFLSVGTLINSWLQTHYVWETLKRPAAPPRLEIPESPRPIVKPESPRPKYRNAATQTEDLEVESKIHSEPKQNHSQSRAASSHSLPRRQRPFTPILFAPGDQIEMVPLGESVSMQPAELRSYSHC